MSERGPASDVQVVLRVSVIALALLCAVSYGSDPSKCDSEWELVPLEEILPKSFNPDVAIQHTDGIVPPPDLASPSSAVPVVGRTGGSGSGEGSGSGSGKAAAPDIRKTGVGATGVVTPIDASIAPTRVTSALAALGVPRSAPLVVKRPHRGGLEPGKGFKREAEMGQEAAMKAPEDQHRYLVPAVLHDEGGRPELYSEKVPYAKADDAKAEWLRRRADWGADSAQGRDPLAWKKDTSVRIIEGLEALDHAGVVHGDIKPDNVRYAVEDTTGGPVIVPKITDFGTARRKGDPADSDGTPLYMHDDFAAMPKDPQIDRFGASLVIRSQYLGDLPGTYKDGSPDLRGTRKATDAPDSDVVYQFSGIGGKVREIPRYSLLARRKMPAEIEIVAHALEMGISPRELFVDAKGKEIKGVDARKEFLRRNAAADAIHTGTLYRNFVKALVNRAAKIKATGKPTPEDAQKDAEQFLFRAIATAASTDYRAFSPLYNTVRDMGHTDLFFNALKRGLKDQSDDIYFPKGSLSPELPRLFHFFEPDLKRYRADPTLLAKEIDEAKRQAATPK